MSDERKLATLGSHLARQHKQLWSAYDAGEIEWQEFRARTGKLFGEACADPLAVLARAQAEAATKAAPTTASAPVKRFAPTDRAKLEQIATQVYATRLQSAS